MEKKNSKTNIYSGSFVFVTWPWPYRRTYVTSSTNIRFLIVQHSLPYRRTFVHSSFRPGVLNLFRLTEPFRPKKSFAVQHQKNSFRGSVFYLKKKRLELVCLWYNKFEKEAVCFFKYKVQKYVFFSAKAEIVLMNIVSRSLVQC